MNYTDAKIEKAYALALKLGLDPKNEFEKNLFINELRAIASSAVCELRSEVADVIAKHDHSYDFKTTEQ